MPFLSQSHGCQGWRGEMSERIRAFDWSTTDLGPLGAWSASLRAAVQLLLGSPQPMVMLWGHHGYMIYNDAYAVFAGGRHPQLLGKPVELGWPEVADFNREVVDTCLAGGTLVYRNKELVLFRHDEAETVWLDLFYSPLADDDGAPGGVLAIVVETTDHVIAERQKQLAETAYRVANERLQLALNAGALLGCFVWDIESGLLTGDERFARTFGFVLADAQNGVPMARKAEAIHPDDRERVARLVDLTIRTGEPYSAEYRIRREDGAYMWVLASGRCEYEGHGQALRFPGVLIDIHERKVAETALLQLTRTLEQRVEDEVQARSLAEERLRQSQKLEAIGGLTGGVAHDFNNVLQVIGGNLHMLKRQQTDNPAVQRRVDAAIAGVERGAKLSAQLLAFARRQQLSPRVYSLQRLYDGVGELLQRALGETIEVQVQLPPAPWNIRVDRNQLENAVLNLVLNARDALQGEGIILLSGENICLDEPACRGRELAPGEYVRLSVCDRGQGMSPQVLEHAFEPFFTTKADGHGTGLGLSMVFGFVKQSGGHIEIDSQLGVGTRVDLYFPRSLASEQPDRPPACVEPLCEQAMILVVEDDVSVRTTVVELLQHAGYQVQVAGNADEAMALLDRGLAVDLIFTDVVMPGHLKSANLAQWARLQTPPIPVLFTSGHTRDMLSHNRQLAPEVNLLAKPYAPDALLRRVCDLLQQAEAAKSAV
ncbi:MAG: PAS domain-containing protein [Gammaproteobacteria bacterium]|nr:PAS domain-containing protein [Gammaproteobacteria bacterium]MBU1488630.1 PAS domain-containing protein [Gammaproteobacteria bacterium]MBU2064755.1 PAS domain-containing protein [Gammaproteobacteria bacterium]MBU2137954.1 PAS domain-containing protein [Gammaproteobacteria bacterium]MBU2215094.1 PAS domain-containing protein [Gammaproteobacteria bacterium]